MRFNKIAAIAAVCGAMAGPAAWGAQSSAWASIYDITFEVESLGYGSSWFTFGPASPEDTTVQAAANGQVDHVDESTTFLASPTLYSALYTDASINEGSGFAWSYAQTGLTYMTAAGSTNISNADPAGDRGTYSASAALNQEYEGVTIAGGWLTLSPMTSIEMSGSYGLLAEIGGTLCGPVECSAAFAGVGYSLGIDSGEAFAHADGGSGPTFDERLDQTFTLTFVNDTDVAMPVFFSTIAYVSGFVAAGLGDGGGGSVPEPDTYALMAFGLGLAGWLTRRRQRPDSPSSTPLLAAAA